MPLLIPSHPGFFGVLATRRAYTTLLYLLAFHLALLAGRFQVRLARHLLVQA